MMTLEEGKALIDRVRAATGELTAQGILSEVVQLLIGRFTIDRASIRIVVPGTPLLEVVAVWTSRETMLTVGTRMSSGSTAYPEILSTGRAELRTNVDPHDGLLDEIMSTEGIRSYVTLPVRDGARLVGLLSLSSHESKTFSEEDLPFLEDLARLVEFAIGHPS